MKKGDRLELSVLDVNNVGCGVCRHDGKVVFVKGAVTGDRIVATVIKDNKSFAVAKLDEVCESSPMRATEKFCEAALSCGGCVYRHVTYEHEKQIKYNHVRSAFDKAGLPEVRVLEVLCAKDKTRVLEVLCAKDKTRGYRNKAQFPVANTKAGMRSGFYASKTHNIVPVDVCSIQHPSFAPITRAVCELCDKYGIRAYDEMTHNGLLRHIYLRVGERTGQIMLCLVINGRSLPYADQIVSELAERFPDVVSIIINENTENTNVVLGKRFYTLLGQSYIEDELCGLRFRISPESFYQVNREGAELLYGLARERAQLDGTQLLADLYCGTGTIGLSMAKDAKRLIGIEIVAGAVECAEQNASFNGILNASFVCGDAGDPKTILTACGGTRPDVVVIDPPRKGSTRELIVCLSDLCVPRVVYVSCDATTLARDCAWFKDAGYDIGDVQPVDMFPRTGHVESVVCLTRK